MDASPLPYSNTQLRQERIRRNWRQQDLADQLGTTVVTIKRWERGSQQPSVYFRIKLCALFGKSSEELGLIADSPQPAALTETEASTPVETVPLSHSPTVPALWSVPYPRNPFFTGREELLHSLHERLNREHTMALTQAWAISGLGGIGKTQIALEYVYQYRQDYHFVFWISATTREVLLADFAALANLLPLPEKDDRDQNRVILAVKQWFASHGGWLLILDNADDVAMVQDIVPMNSLGHLMLTSRAQALGSLAQRIDVEDMGIVESTLFLLRRAKLLAPDAFLDQVSEEQLAAAEAIVIEIAFFPLALDQAGAYVEEVGCSLSTYLDLYQAHRQQLLQRRSQLSAVYPESIATIWSLNFHQIKQANPIAAELLCLCAFLEPDTISEDLLAARSVAPDAVVEPIAKDAFHLNRAIEELRKFSLVQRNPATKTLRIHRMLQAVLKDAMEKPIQRQWAERAIRATNHVFPEQVEMATWAECQRYLPQAQVCSTLIHEYAFTFAETASLLFRTANYLQMHALYEQAEPLYQRSLRIRENPLGLEHLEIAKKQGVNRCLTRER